MYFKTCFKPSSLHFGDHLVPVAFLLYLLSMTMIDMTVSQLEYVSESAWIISTNVKLKCIKQGKFKWSWQIMSVVIHCHRHSNHLKWQVKKRQLQVKLTISVILDYMSSQIKSWKMASSSDVDNHCQLSVGNCQVKTWKKGKFKWDVDNHCQLSVGKLSSQNMKKRFKLSWQSWSLSWTCHWIEFQARICKVDRETPPCKAKPVASSHSLQSLPAGSQGHETGLQTWICPLSATDILDCHSNSTSKWINLTDCQHVIIRPSIVPRQLGNGHQNRWRRGSWSRLPTAKAQWHLCQFRSSRFQWWWKLSSSP